MARARTLVETEHVVLRELRCGSRRGGPGESRGGEGTHFVLVKRGAFAAHLGRRMYVADACTALVSWEGVEYQISHPGDHGDACLVMELSPALAEEALAPLRTRVDVELRMSAAMQRAAAAFAARMQRGTLDARLAGEEAVLELLRGVLGERGKRRSLAGEPAAGTSARRELARRAVLALHRDLSANPSVTSLAAELGCSPFHLMRAVRQELGVSLRGYRIAARLGAALHRLAEGEADLTRLALELGFASHAHLTGTCVRLLGAPPSELRRGLDARASTFLEARRRATS
jgi:AraC family transcriptional regulator